MKKTPDTYRTLQNNSPSSQLKSYASYKISYLPSLNFNFEQLINNRLKVTDTPQASKSIFFLKGKFNRQDPRYKFNQLNQTKTNFFPQLTFSTNLDIPNISRQDKNSKSLPKQLQKTPSFEKFSATRNNILYKKRSQTKQQYSFDQRIHRNTLQKTNYQMHMQVNNQQKLKNQKLQKEQPSLDDIVIGNKTKLNFRRKNNEIQFKKKRIIDVNNKIKFSTFKNPTSDICPWNLSDVFEEA